VSNSDLKLPPPQSVPSKKAYKSPSLVKWGSLAELTGGPAADFQDADFNGGSGGD
jgi:hypothetical protein